MNDAILTALHEKERQTGCRVLLAVEAGSRAWGFASPDSDYDVRFLYVFPAERYLRMEPPEDTLSWFDGDLDFSGWELRKALRLFATCNPSLNEHLGSPTVYHADAALLGPLQSLVPAYFQPGRVIHHYLGTAAKFTAPLRDSREVGIKKFFYILRPLLAADWAARSETMPPTEFSRLLADADLPGDVRLQIDALLAQKSRAAEKDTVMIPDALRAWTCANLDRLAEAAKGFAKPDFPGWEPLDELFRQMVEGI